MSELITKYFHDSGEDEEKNQFFPPATEKQISGAEHQFGIEFPKDYIDFLRFTNGFDGMVGESIAIFEPVQTLYQTTRTTTAGDFAWVVYLGSNAGLEMYVLSTKSKPYQFGLLPNLADENDFIALGETFEQFISRLYTDTAFDKM